MPQQGRRLFRKDKIMKTLKTVTTEINDAVEMVKIVEVYEEAAATKMSEIRKETLESRDYYEGLLGLSGEIGADFARVSEGKLKKAAVFVSANAGLYGDIVIRTFFLFLDFIKKETVDVFIVGHVGEELMRRHTPDTPFETFKMPDDAIEAEKFDFIAKSLAGYRDIYVFYPKFKSLVYQETGSVKISSDMLSGISEEIRNQGGGNKALAYLYEPNVEVVSKFFGEEIMMASMEQMFREGQLARFAARLMHLDSAINSLDKKIATFSFEKRKIKKRLNDKRQRSTVTAILSRGGF